MHVTVDSQDVATGWRIVLSIATPDTWIQHPATFWPGLFLSVLGLAALLAYSQSVDPMRFTAIEYPVFTIASWVFGLLALLSLFDTSAHVADIGTGGLDWRFLASLRTTPIDLIVMGLSSAACVACWLASWGFVSGRWVTEPDASEHEQEAHTE